MNEFSPSQLIFPHTDNQHTQNHSHCQALPRNKSCNLLHSKKSLMARVARTPLSNVSLGRPVRQHADQTTQQFLPSMDWLDIWSISPQAATSTCCPRSDHQKFYETRSTRSTGTDPSQTCLQSADMLKRTSYKSCCGGADTARASNPGRRL